MLWPGKLTFSPSGHFPNTSNSSQKLFSVVLYSVFVECGQFHNRENALVDHLESVGESRGVAAIASTAQLPLHIIAFTNLCQTVEQTREALRHHVAAAQGRLRGIRNCLTWDPSDEMVSQRMKGIPEHVSQTVEFRKSFGVLQEFGLLFETYLYHPQIGDLQSLAEAFPDQTIILNHVGFPLGSGPWADSEGGGHMGRRGPSLAVEDKWRKSILALAQCPNVLVKLSGLTMPVTGFGWERDGMPPSSEEVAWHLAPFYLECIRAFGPERCIVCLHRISHLTRHHAAILFYGMLSKELLLGLV